MADLKKRRGGQRAVGKARSPLPLPVPVVPHDVEKPQSVLLPGVALAAGILLFVFLLRFAVDILLWVLVLALFALVLHYLLVWLAESELLSAPWLFIIVLTMGAATWMLWPESSFQQGLDITHYLPAPVVEVIKWAEERSLTRRALVATPAPREAPETAPVSSPASTPAGAIGTVASISIVVTGAPATSRIGDPVTFVATVRVAGGSPRGVVQFFDGPLLLGEAALQPAGRSGRASLTATGLSVGAHRITAGYGGVTSAGLVHAVAGG